MRRKEIYLQNFFSSFDPSVLAKRCQQRRQLCRERGEPHAGSSAGLGKLKEGPFEETPIDCDGRRYNFYYLHMTVVIS